MNLLVSFSGGRSSAMMAHHIKYSNKYKHWKKLFVFANTGKEREETLEFVNECDKSWSLDLVWVEAVTELKKGVGTMGMTTNFKNASRKGEPFISVMEKYSTYNSSHPQGYTSVPNNKAPYCSRDLKVTPINKIAKEYFKTNKYLTALGMRYEDMPKRVSLAELNLPYHERALKVYPLLEDFNTFQTQKDVLDFWSKQDFDLGIDSSIGNCDLCWKKSDRKIIQVLRNEPERAKWWIENENHFGSYFLRGNRSFADLLAHSKLNTTLNIFDDQGES